MTDSFQVIESVKSRRSWALDEPSFGRLLAALGQNRENAASRFERLRARLTQFFTYEA